MSKTLLCLFAVVGVAAAALPPLPGPGTPDKPIEADARPPLENGGNFKVLKWPNNLSKPAKEASAKLAEAESRLPTVKPVNLEGPVPLKPSGDLPKMSLLQVQRGLRGAAVPNDADSRAPLENGGSFKPLKWPNNLSKQAKQASAKLAEAENRLPAVKPVNLEGPVPLKPSGDLPVLP